MNKKQEIKLREYVKDLVADYVISLDLEFMAEELVEMELIKDIDEELEIAGNMVWEEFRKFIGK